MSQKGRSTYSSQFKQDAVKRAVESDQPFFHTLKTELAHHRDFNTRAEARAEIFEYTEVFYNRQRPHFANEYEAPLVFEEMLKAA